jgi:hypothetical protein
MWSSHIGQPHLPDPFTGHIFLTHSLAGFATHMRDRGGVGGGTRVATIRHHCPTRAPPSTRRLSIELRRAATRSGCCCNRRHELRTGAHQLNKTFSNILVHRETLVKMGNVSLAVLGSVVLMFGASAVRAQNTAHVQILSATVRDQKIDGATVILQKNGEQSSAARTDLQGQAQVSESIASDPSTLLIVRKEGYSDLVAKCPCVGMTYAMSLVMEKLDGLRIVLNWGATPADLDGHLAFPGNHIFFHNKFGTDAMLDVDHLDGYGPETITVARKHNGERYIYAVQNFSDRQDPTSNRLSLSDAKVFVYIGQTLIRTYYVPKNRAGNVWTVFAVAADGELTDINSMSGISVISSVDVTAEQVFGASFAAVDHAASNPSTAPSATQSATPLIPESARKLNNQGESVYKTGDYAGAISLFQSAIEQAGSYGQAYSNLGLAFQKSGRVAEALWANRKAIALADGPSAATTRAGTHFNNGRIYEDAHQWDDALREYQAAQAEKNKPTYENAIQRMREHAAR